MKCAKCGLDIPQGSRQCPKCGSINEFEQAAPSPKKRLSPVAYATIALAIIGVFALGFYVLAGRGRNLTAAPGGIQRQDGNITAAPPGVSGPNGIMAAPPGAPGQTQPTLPGKPKPPQEVVDYLAHVKKVEEHRQMLLKDTSAAMTLSATGGGSKGMMDMINMAMDPEGKAAQDPLAETKAELNRQYSNWQKTLNYFDSKPAPAQCREFSGSYRAVLANETKTLGEISTSFNGLNIQSPDDMSKLLTALQKMKGDPSIQANIDKSANDADAKLTSLVSNYDMQKPFDVPPEKQGGNIMGF